LKNFVWLLNSSYYIFYLSFFILSTIILNYFNYFSFKINNLHYL